MINRIIYLPIEIKKREFDARCYQSLKIINNGFDAVICTKSAIKNFSANIPIGVVYFKSLGPRYLNLLEYFKKRGFANICLDEESISIVNEKLYLKRFYNKNLKHLDILFAWGSKDFSILKKKFKKIKLYKVGNPRVDILVQKTNKLYHDISKKIKKKYGKFILLNSFLTMIMHRSHKDHGTYLKQIKNNKDYKWGKREISISKQQVEMQKKIFLNYKKLFDRFYREFKDKKMIVRPHPVENHDIWKKLLLKYDNIIFANDDNSACSWMLASQFSISSNCTTAIESHLLNKFNINFRPVKNKNVEFTLPKNCSLNIESVDKLISFIKKNINRDKLNINYFGKKNHKILSNWIENFFDKKCSVEKMIKILESNINFENKKNFKNESNKFINLDAKEKTKIKMREISNFFNYKILKSKKYLGALQKQPGFDAYEITKRMNLLKKHLNMKINFSVKEETPGLFLIKKIN